MGNLGVRLDSIFAQKIEQKSSCLQKIKLFLDFI